MDTKNKIRPNEMMQNSKRKNIIAVGLMCQAAATMFIVFGGSIALPAMVGKFNAMSRYALVSVCYSVAACIVMPVFAGLGDNIGRKWIVTFTLSGTCVSLVLTAFAPNLTVLMVARTLTGICVGGFQSSTMVIMSDITQPEERGKYIGFAVTATAVGMLLGPVIAGIVVDSGWTGSAFLLPIPLLLCAAVTLGLLYPNKRNTVKFQFDFLGCLYLFLAVVPFVIILNFAGSYFRWVSPYTFVFAAVSIIFLFFLVKRELSVEQPAINLELMKNANVRSASVSAFLYGSYSVLSAGFIALVGKAVLGVSTTVSGTFLLPQNIVSLIFPFFLSKLLSRNKRRYKSGYILQGILAAIVLFGISLLQPGSPVITVYILMALGGISYTLFTQMPATYMQMTLTPDKYGSAQGIQQFFSTLGMAVITCVFSMILGNVTDYPRALSLCFTIGAGMCVLMSLYCLIFIKAPKLPADIK